MKSLNDSLEEYKKIEYNKNSLQSYARFLERLKTFEVIIESFRNHRKFGYFELY